MNRVQQLEMEVQELKSRLHELNYQPYREQFAKRLGELLALQALSGEVLPDWAREAWDHVARELPAIAPIMGVDYD